METFMETINWGTVGDIANAAQLTGLNIPKLIAMIIQVASNALILKQRCRDFGKYVKSIGDVLEEITMKDLMKSPGTTKILKQLEDVLRVSHGFLQSCHKKRNFCKILFSKQLDKAEAEIDRYVKLIPLVNCLYILQMKAANEGSDKLGHAKIYEELHFNSDLYLSSSQDPHIHFQYIQVLVKIGRIDEVERVTREGHIYDAEKTKNFLMETRLSDIRPLINVCERFRFVPDLIRYLYSNSMLQYIEHCVQVDGWQGVRDYYHKRGRLNELNSIMQGGLEQVRDYYQKRGRLNELISIMQGGLEQRA